MKIYIFKYRWPEIEEMLLPGQTGYDREDIVNMVFKARLTALLYNIRNGKYFGSKVLYEIHVIEYQHRGAPHAHIIVRFENAPKHNRFHENYNNDILTADWIDKYISAKMPVIDENSSQDDKEYHQKVNDYMIHKCYSASRGGCLLKDGQCKRNYNKELISETHFDECGFPVYARPCEADLQVVPHCRALLMDCDSHIKVEYAASVYCAVYLYGYLFKGSKKDVMELNNLQDTKKRS